MDRFKKDLLTVLQTFSSATARRALHQSLQRLKVIELIAENWRRYS